MRLSPCRHRLMAGPFGRPGRLLGFGLAIGVGVVGDTHELGTVVYQGALSESQQMAFVQQVAARAVITRLRITSNGGSVRAGIALGHWVRNHRLDVEVRGVCQSACANYVFPAGQRQVIAPDSLVAWHGTYQHLLATGQWRDDMAYRQRRYGEERETARRRAKAMAQDLATAEARLFERLGVDGRIAWIGKLPPYRVPRYYALSVPAMARFGVERVAAPTGYPAGAVRQRPEVQHLRLTAGITEVDWPEGWGSQEGSEPRGADPAGEPF